MRMELCWLNAATKLHVFEDPHNQFRMGLGKRMYDRLLQ
jgi:hypothetical protein